MVISSLVLTCFYAWQRVMLHIFDSNNCWEPLEPCGVIIQSYLKTPVWGASLSYHDYHVASRRLTPIPSNGKHQVTKQLWQFITHHKRLTIFIPFQLHRALLFSLLLWTVQFFSLKYYCKNWRYCKKFKLKQIFPNKTKKITPTGTPGMPDMGH